MKRTTLITLILGTTLAVAPAAHAKVLSEGGSSYTTSVVAPTTGMSQPEYRALMIRSEALNQKYGLSSQASNTGISKAEFRALMIRSEALNQKYGLSSQASNTGISKAEHRALMIRSEALNQKYGLGSSATVTDGWTNSVTPSYSFRPDILGGNGSVSAQPTATGGDSFEWGTVGIGAATLIGVMLLGAASLAVTRRRHQPSF